MTRHLPRGPCPSNHQPINKRCFAHKLLQGSTTQRKLAIPGSSRGIKNNTHTQAPRDTSTCPRPPSRSDFLRTACAPTSTQSNGFCAIRVCISSSSSSSSSTSATRCTTLGPIHPTPPRSGLSRTANNPAQPRSTRIKVAFDGFYIPSVVETKDRARGIGRSTWR